MTPNEIDLSLDGLRGRVQGRQGQHGAAHRGQVRVRVDGEGAAGLRGGHGGAQRGRRDGVAAGQAQVGRQRRHGRHEGPRGRPLRHARRRRRGRRHRARCVRRFIFTQASAHH